MAGVAVDTRHWIGGRRVASAATFTDFSPIDGAPIAEVARGGPAEVAGAVSAAKAAFTGWAATPPDERAAVLRAIGAGVRARIAELSRSLSKPRWFPRSIWYKRLRPSPP